MAPATFKLSCPVDCTVTAPPSGRLAVLDSYGILDTPPEKVFDDLTELAAAICEAPIALISLVAQNRQWFKARVGVDVSETPLEVSFCKHTLQQPDELFIVPDATRDSRFADNPLVTGDMGIRFYAGAPLVTPDGVVLGALCVIDRVPRTLTPAQEQALRILRNQVMTQLEVARQHRTQLRTSEERLRMVTEHAPVGLAIFSRERSFVFANPAYAAALNHPGEDLAGRPLKEVFGPHYWRTHHPLLVRAFAGERAHLETLLATPGGNRNVDIMVQPVFSGGEVMQVVSVLADVNERHLAHTTQSRLVAIVESSDDAIVGQNRDGIITSWNLGAEKIFGYTAAEMLGAPVSRLIPEGQHEEEAFILDTIRNGGSVEHFETQRRRRDGRTIDVSITASPIKDSAGVIVGLSKVARDFTARKKAETDMHLFRILIDQSYDTVEIIDVETGRFLDVNTKGAADRGYTRAEYLELYVWDVEAEFHAADWQRTVANIRRSGALTGRGEHRRKDGTTFSTEFNASLVRMEREYIVTVVRDITRRKKIEAALVERERQLTLFVKHCPVAVAMLDTRMHYLVVSQRWLENHALGEQSIVGRCHYQVLPGIAEKRRPTHQRCLAGATEKSDGEAIVLPDGRVRWIRWEIRPWFRTREAVGGLIIFSEDITEQGAAAEKIREQAALLDQAHDAILVRDLEHRILFWNRGAERLYGWTAQEVAGTSTKDLLYDDPTAFLAAMAHTVERGEWNGEIEQRTRAGAKLTIAARWTLLRDEQGQPKSILAINSDITERKLLEQQFLRAQRLEGIGTLASGVAHDLNNILSPILMCASVLESALVGTTQQEMVECISQSARRGANLVKQVLTFARGAGGEMIPLQLHHLMRDMDKIATETFPRSIRVSNGSTREIWPVIGDATQLHQVLLNLCVNARDAMPDGGTLTLNAENIHVDQSYAAMIGETRPGPFVLLTVSDTGHGIPPEIVQKIFDPFFTTKDAASGTGLGLSTVIGIVKRHCGTISMESEVGKGTTFKVFLPAQPECAEIELTERPQDQPPEGHDELVLVVDDETAIRTTAQSVLQAFGYRVLLAGDGMEALIALSQHVDEIAAVITDLNMPIMDGALLLQALRKTRPQLPIIISTGEADKANAGKLPANAFLVKPYDADTLLRTLHSVLCHDLAIGGGI